MRRRTTGRYETVATVGEAVRAFVPAPLPPSPPITLTPARRCLHDRALLACGRLDGIQTIAPQHDLHLYLYTYVRREALLSSQIEGTQSSLSDLLLFELEAAPGAPLDDVREVSNYVAALEAGTQELARGGPLTNRLLRSLHGMLLASGRGAERQPGEYRGSQNWIGGTRPGNAHYVPPPAHVVVDCMADLERFINDGGHALGPLLRAGFAHVQFESIHPFLDGNGRLGRLLIALLLHHDEVLRQPLLYLSLFFKERRQEYYGLLDGVRSDRDWEAWTDFFLTGIEATASGAIATARRLTERFGEDAERVRGLPRQPASLLRTLEAFRPRPVATISLLAHATGASYNTTAAAVERLQGLGIVHEVTGRARGRVYAYQAYLAILSEGAEPLP